MGPKSEMSTLFHVPAAHKLKKKGNNSLYKVFKKFTNFGTGSHSTSMILTEYLQKKLELYPGGTDRDTILSLGASLIWV